MGYSEVHTLDQRIQDAQQMLKKLIEYRNSARKYTTPSVSVKCRKNNKKVVDDATRQIQVLQKLIRSAEKAPVRFGMANYTDIRAHNQKKRGRKAPEPSAAFFSSFKGAKSPEEGASLGNRLFAAATNVGDALSDMVARAAGPLAEPAEDAGSEDETVIVYQSESDNHSDDDQTVHSIIASPRKKLPRRNIKVTESRLKLFFATLPERIIASYTFDILVALFAFVFLLKIGACKIVQFKFQEF